MLLTYFLAQFAFEWDADALLENRRNIVSNKEFTTKTAVVTAGVSASVSAGMTAGVTVGHPYKLICRV